ncbi:MAG: hypothetical protein ACREA7_07880 [Nitrosotalea sp.]
MTNLERLRKQLDSIKTEIDKLSGFRDTSFVRKFRRQLEGENSVIREQIKRLTQTREQKETLQSITEKIANRNRSEKMKRTWRYLKAIKKNYPIDISLRELRTAYKKHRQGLETDISNVVWSNPSP